MAVFEIKDKAEKVAIASDDLFLISDSEALQSLKNCKYSTIEDSIVSTVSQNAFAVGDVKEVMLMQGVTTPALTDSWALLNGQLINDAESTLFDGKRVPNAIGANVTLTLTFS